jgi:hypothetical protein
VLVEVIHEKIVSLGECCDDVVFAVRSIANDEGSGVGVQATGSVPTLRTFLNRSLR